MKALINDRLYDTDVDVEVAYRVQRERYGDRHMETLYHTYRRNDWYLYTPGRDNPVRRITFNKMMAWIKHNDVVVVAGQSPTAGISTYGW